MCVYSIWALNSSAGYTIYVLYLENDGCWVKYYESLTATYGKKVLLDYDGTGSTAGKTFSL